MPEQSPYRRARFVFGIVCLGSLALYAYKKYQDRSFYRRWTVWKAYSDTLESWRSIASTLRLLSQDLSEFVHAQSAEDCPESVRRVLTLVSSPECIGALSRVLDGLTARTAEQPAVIDKILEAALSDRGQSLVGMAVGISTTKVVQALCQAVPQVRPNSHGHSKAEHHPVLVWLSTPAAQTLVRRSVATFVSTGVATYCDKVAGEDVYGDMMQALAKPSHLEAVKSLASTVCHTSITAAAQSMRSPAAVSNGGNGVARKQAHAGPHLGLPGTGDGHAATPQPAGQPIQRAWTEELIHACSSPDVRQTVADAARASCAGAVEAGMANISHQLLQGRHAQLVATVLLSWLLLIPLWLLHASAIAPGRPYM